jgi:outer membrane murein-binding lipoprotein Lpp
MQGTSTVRNPQTPVANTPPIAGGVAGTQVPRTTAEVRELKAKRDELAGQLNAAVGRRNAISQQLRNPVLTAADRAGLEQRLAVLDQRIAQLETDIATNGRLLVLAPGTLLSSTSVSGNFFPSPGQTTAISIVGTVFVLAPLSFAFARLMLRRAANLGKTLPPSPDLSNRLDRMEQGIEAIAIEVERISEGQRFVTNLIGEKSRQRPNE